MSFEEVLAKRLKTDKDVEPHCLHWVQRKKRFCKMTLIPGCNYCGEHRPIAHDELADDARIPCPLDNKHTVYKYKLQKHLKICNARQKDNSPTYIVKDINAGPEIATEILESYANIKLNELKDEEFYAIIEKVERIFEKYVAGKIEQLDVQHKLLEVELNNEEYGKESRKHLQQTAALLGILDTNHQIQANTTFIEFGAGKGQLAYYLTQLLQSQKKSQVVLLDRMSLRHKKDNKVIDKSLVQRLRADIADFYMPGFELLQQTSRVVAFSKHLCGSATDLSLRCITQPCKETNDKLELHYASTEFIMIALCCHHRCEWRSFVGKEFMLSQGIDARQFIIITKMVSWAICGTGMSRERRRDLALQNLPTTDTLNDATPQRLTLQDRERIGFMCKRILDYARIEYLRQNHYEAALKYYVTKDVTLENACLIATKIC